jgi:hypothetical protein
MKVFGINLHLFSSSSRGSAVAPQPTLLGDLGRGVLGGVRGVLRVAQDKHSHKLEKLEKHVKKFIKDADRQRVDPLKFASLSMRLSDVRGVSSGCLTDVYWESVMGYQNQIYKELFPRLHNELFPPRVATSAPASLMQEPRPFGSCKSELY